MSAVTEILAKRNIRYVRIAGDVPPEVRAVSVIELCSVAVNYQNLIASYSLNEM